jgi:DNA-binding transcriptional regulator PaaX
VSRSGSGTENETTVQCPSQSSKSAPNVTARHVLRASWTLRAGDREAIADAFELDELAARYAEFAEQYASQLDWAREGVEPREALRVRTKLTNDWLAFRLADPELPVGLLPDGWPRPRAREVFLHLYDLLGPAAAAQVRQIVARYDEPLSRIVTHQGALRANQRLTPEMLRAVEGDRRRSEG